MTTPIRIEHVELALDPDTPFFLDLGRAGEEAVAVLDRLVADADLHLGVRAVSLCGHVPGSAALAVLARAAASARPALREAAARALASRRDDPPELLASLLADPDVRVRAQALAVLAERPRRTRLRHLRHLRRLRARDPDPRVRRLAATIRLIRNERAPGGPTLPLLG